METALLQDLIDCMDIAKGGKSFPEDFYDGDGLKDLAHVPVQNCLGRGWVNFGE